MSCPFPERRPHAGRYVRLEPLGAVHAPALWEVARGAQASWTYLRYGPFASLEEMASQIRSLARMRRQPFFAAVPATSGRAEGWLSYCDIDAGAEMLEIGSIWFSPRFQRTRAATEAVFLLIDHAFGLGYRRVAWRCNADNAPSNRAAQRFGFRHEGNWRQAETVKGKPRDTAWYSLLGEEWRALRPAYEAWLDPANFDAAGRQRMSLSALR
ncbi:GNAT family N-acetyltransferase [Sphingomonas oleivorans]|uniref:GNAT family N-acetyltransferase n=2 Tax=Sphingomonas oleivorans TaxID=1735121 RepID=A0A2T5FZC1_9SPHN|nr:GNAT family protein [Sphingomonas oleivorans]PTQ12043.1 GNAT family N-acetyltransferase [Sphingomonas oleivorans]